MKKRLYAAVAAAFLLSATAVLGQVSYPNSIYSSTSPATKRDGSLSQQEWIDDIDEINAIETELGANYTQRGVLNFVRNGSFEQWTAGASSAPDFWTLTGTSAAIAQSTDVQDGSSSAQMTAGSAVSKLSYTALATISATSNTHFRGQAMTLSARVKSTAASVCQVQISDGVGSSQSAAHTGDGTWQILSVTRSLDALATTLTADLLNGATDSLAVCKFDSVQIVEGKFVGKAFANARYDPTGPGGGSLSEAQLGAAGAGTGTITMDGTFAVTTATVGNGADITEDVLYTFTVPGSTLDVNGKRLHVHAQGITAANTDTKTVRIRWGGAAGTIIAALSPATTVANKWMMDADIFRVTATSQYCSGIGISSSSGAANVVTNVLDDVTPTQTLSSTITIVVTGQAGVATANDIVAHTGYVTMSN